MKSTFCTLPDLFHIPIDLSFICSFAVVFYTQKSEETKNKKKYFKTYVLVSDQRKKKHFVFSWNHSLSHQIPTPNADIFNETCTIQYYERSIKQTKKKNQQRNNRKKKLRLQDKIGFAPITTATGHWTSRRIALFITTANRDTHSYKIWFDIVKPKKGKKKKKTQPNCVLPFHWLGLTRVKQTI